MGIRLMGAVVLTILSASSALAQEGSSARAVLMDTQGNFVGNAFLRAVEDGVQIQVRINNFDSVVTADERGQHGFHIHEVGECNPPDFQSAGSHYNPTGNDHGLLDPDGPHAGDLPNLWLEADGSADYSVTTNLISLDAGERSVLDEDGSAIILHSQPDDHITDPSGDSGDRLACGVIYPE